MNINEAISRLKKMISPLRDIDSKLNNRAIGLAISVLRIKQEQDNPKTLTILKLYNRLEETLWLKIGTSIIYAKLIEINNGYCYFIDRLGDHVNLRLDYYDKSWFAYDHEPKGE